MSSYSRSQLETMLREINVSGKVIDIGGSQNPIKGRTKTWEVEVYHVLDLLHPHEQKKQVDIVLDINDPMVLKYLHQPIELGIYDVAFCIEVMEYVWNPVQALLNIGSLLKPGGILYISFHWFYPLHNPVGFDYYRYSYYGVRKLLLETGFIVNEVKVRALASHQTELDRIFNMEGMRYNTSEQRVYDQGYLIEAIKN